MNFISNFKNKFPVFQKRNRMPGYQIGRQESSRRKTGKTMTNEMKRKTNIVYNTTLKVKAEITQTLGKNTASPDQSRCSERLSKSAHVLNHNRC